MTAALTFGLALIVVGCLLMVADLFLPSGGVLSVVGVGVVLVGVVFLFIYDHTVGLWSLVALFVAVPVGGMILLQLWPMTPMGKRFMLPPPEEGEGSTMAELAAHRELEGLRGRVGKAVSALRPAGTVDFDGRLVDTITEGMMVDPGQWVRCIDVRAGRVVVRAIDKPDLSTLENADFA